MVLPNNIIQRTMVGTALVAVLLGCQEPSSVVTYSRTQTDPVVIPYPQPKANVIIEYFCPDFTGERATAVVSKEQHKRFLDSASTGIPVSVHAEIPCVLQIDLKDESSSPVRISVYTGGKPHEWVLAVPPDDDCYLIADPPAFERALSDLRLQLGWK